MGDTDRMLRDVTNQKSIWDYETPKKRFYGKTAPKFKRMASPFRPHSSPIIKSPLKPSGDQKKGKKAGKIKGIGNKRNEEYEVNENSITMLFHKAKFDPVLEPIVEEIEGLGVNDVQSMEFVSENESQVAIEFVKRTGMLLESLKEVVEEKVVEGVDLPLVVVNPAAENEEPMKQAEIEEIEQFIVFPDENARQDEERRVITPTRDPLLEYLSASSESSVDEILDLPFDPSLFTGLSIQGVIRTTALPHTLDDDELAM